MEREGRRDDVASSIVVSYAPATDAVGRELTRSSYRGYLRKANSGRVAAGDVWTEFVSRGCGGTREVELRVERVVGGSTIGPETEFEFVPDE